MSLIQQAIKNIVDKLNYVNERLSKTEQLIDEFKEILLKCDSNLLKIKSFISQEAFDDLKEDIWNVKVRVLRAHAEILKNKEVKRQFQEQQKTKHLNQRLFTIQEEERELDESKYVDPIRAMTMVLPTVMPMSEEYAKEVEEQFAKNPMMKQIYNMLPNPKAKRKFINSLHKLEITNYTHNGNPLFKGNNDGLFYINENGNRTYVKRR